MILSIGEILIDQIINKDGTIEKYVGGAPLNMAYNALSSGAKVGFVGSIGKDDNGKIIKNYVSNFGFDYVNLEEKDLNTTVALLKINQEGERDFKFLRNNCADYQINFDDIAFNKCKNLNIIHLGTLMLNTEEGRDFSSKVIKYAKKNNLLVSVDLNIRLDLFKCIEDLRKAYKYVVDNADILKLSYDEVLDYTGLDYEEAIESLKKDKILAITKSKDGSTLYYNNRIIDAKTIEVKPVDTTGAGDAFFGSLVAKLDGVNLDELTDNEIEDILKYANKKGADTCLFKGAINVK